MERLAASRSLLRFCECKRGEIAGDGAASNGRSTTLLMGTAVSAKWDPTHPRRLGILYSSGVFRLWDCVADAHRDFCLYLPAAGLPATRGASAAELTIADRRSAAPIVHFDFLPLIGPASIPSIGADGAPRFAPLPRLVFATRRSLAVGMADVPPETHPGADHYLSGARVYELPASLPAAPTALCSWRVAAAPEAVAAVAVGCDDGRLGVWLVSQAFNPESVASLRSRRDASPAFLLAQQQRWPGDDEQMAAMLLSAAGGGGCSSSLITTSHKDSGNGGPWVDAHARRVRCLAPLHVKAGAEFALEAAADSPATVSAAAAAAAAAADPLLVSSGDCGRVRIWRVVVAPSAAAAAAASAAAGGDPFLSRAYGQQQQPPPGVATSFEARLEPYLAVPTDGLVTTALCSAAWPLPTSPVLEAGAGLAARQAPRAAGAGFGAMEVLPAPCVRALLVCGSAEGVVTAWEVLAPAVHCAVLPPAAPGPVWRRSQQQPLHPSVRLIGMVSACAADRIAAVAVVAPGAADEVAAVPGRGWEDHPFKVAVAGVDGSLTLYRLEGTEEGGGGFGLAHDRHASGSSGPVTLAYHGSGGGVADPEPTAFDTVRSGGREAEALRAMAEAEEALLGGGTSGGSSSSSSSSFDTGASAGSAGQPGYPGAGDGGAARVLLGRNSSWDGDDELAMQRRAVTSALTVAAVGKLHRSFVACTVNQWALPPADAADAAAIGALLAVNGAGQVMLWPAGGMPGDDAAAELPPPEEVEGQKQQQAAAWGDLPPPAVSALARQSSFGSAGGETVLSSASSPGGTRHHHHHHRSAAAAAEERRRAYEEGIAAASGTLAAVARRTALHGNAEAAATVAGTSDPLLLSTEASRERGTHTETARAAAPAACGATGEGSSDEDAVAPVPRAAAELSAAAEGSGDAELPHASSSFSFFAAGDSLWPAAAADDDGWARGSGLPRALDETVCSAGKRRRGGADGPCDEAGGGRRGSAARSLPRSAREYLRRAAEDAVRPLYHAAASSRSSRSPTHAPVVPRSRSGSRGRGRPHGADASGASLKASGSLGRAQHLHILGQPAAAAGEAAAVAAADADPVKRALQHRKAEVARKLGVAATVPPPGSSPARGAAADGDPSSSSSSPSRAPLRGGADTASAATAAASAAETRGRRIAAGVVRGHNPARMAAALVRDARESARVAVRLARERAAAAGGLETTGDEHPDGLAMHARLSGEGCCHRRHRYAILPAAAAAASAASASAVEEVSPPPQQQQQHHHLVAPSVGSSAAIAAEIARLQGLAFDADAVLARTLRQRGLGYDPRVAEDARRRLHGSTAAAAADHRTALLQGPDGYPTVARSGAEVAAVNELASEDCEEEDETFAYVPAARGAHSRAAAAASAAPTDAQAAGDGSKLSAVEVSRIERLLQPLNGRRRGSSHLQSEAVTVSASDVVKWHYGLREEQRRRHDSNPAPEKTTTVHNGRASASASGGSPG